MRQNYIRKPYSKKKDTRIVYVRKTNQENSMLLNSQNQRIEYVPKTNKENPLSVPNNALRERGHDLEVTTVSQYIGVDEAEISRTGSESMDSQSLMHGISLKDIVDCTSKIF